MPDYIVAECTDRDECGWRETVGRVIPATRYQPQDYDGDIPDECPECGADVTTTVENPADDYDMDDYDMEDYR